MTIILLLSGPLAVGKTAVRDAAESRFNFKCLRSSTHLTNVARAKGRAEDRRGLQDLGDQLDQETDYRWVIDEVALPAIRSFPAQSRWAVDAVRKQRQIDRFRAAFGGSVFHVHLDAPESVLRQRYERRKGSDIAAKDVASYESAIDHDNEREARSLKDTANLVLNIADLDAESAVEAILFAASQSSR